MGRPSRRSRAIKNAKRNANGKFGNAPVDIDTPDSDCDMDIDFEFVDAIDVSDHDYLNYCPPLEPKKRGRST